MTKKFQFNKVPEQILWLMQNGAVGILPTDTVYGVVTQVNNLESVKRLYALKSREAKPGTIIAANTQQLIDMGVDKRHIDIANVYWPNSTSVVLPVGESLAYIHQGINSLAFRVVSDPELVLLLELTGPLLTSSANSPGEPVANDISQARNYFGDSVDFYIDGGDLVSRQASTVIKVDKSGISILRDGAVKIECY